MNKAYKIFVYFLLSAAIHGYAEARTVTIELGEILPLNIKGDISTIYIADQTIADVSHPAPEKVLLITKRLGSTTLAVLNKDANIIYKTEIIVKPNKRRTVGVRRGGNLSVYDCAPECQPVEAAETAEAATSE